LINFLICFNQKVKNHETFAGFKRYIFKTIFTGFSFFLVFSNKFNWKWNPRKKILKGFVYFQQKRGLVDMFGEKV